MHILIAEDEVSIARALQLMLEKNKYAVDVVHSGTDALDYILAGDYDALVLDIMMPDMDGISVLTEVRRRGITTPTLFLTAKSEIEDRIAGLDAGADDYLPKPFASGEFLARVRALVRRSSAYAPDILTFGGITLDAGTYILRAAGGAKNVRTCIERYAAERENVGRIGTAAPHKRTYPRKKLARSKGFGQIVICARVQSGDPILNLAFGREEERGCRYAAPPHFRKNGYAVHIGHHNVQYERIIVARQNVVERVGAAVNNVHGIFVLFEHELQRTGNAHLVLGNKDVHADPS